MPLTSLYRPPRQRRIEPLMIAGRTCWQAHVAPADLRGVRMIYKAPRGVDLPPPAKAEAC
jgi:KDO2-lipid IV(A) lauroyltransferase